MSESIDAIHKRSDEYRKNVLVQAYFDPTEQTGLTPSQCFFVLSELIKHYGYDAWTIELNPPSRFPSSARLQPLQVQPAPSDDSPDISGPKLEAHFEAFMNRVVDSLGIFDAASERVWLTRPVEIAIAEHTGEVVIHPKLIGMRIPDFLIKNACRNVEFNKCNQLVESGFSEVGLSYKEDVHEEGSVSEKNYDRGYKDALETVLLALKNVPLLQGVLTNMIETAMDAHSNNANGDVLDESHAESQNSSRCGLE